MKCPGCSTEVADGTSICPSCDYIIDDSFLGSAPAPAPEERGEGDTNPGIKRPSPPPTRSGKKRKVPAKKAKKGNGSAHEDIPEPLPSPVPLAPTMPTRYAPESPGARSSPSYSPVFSPEEAMADARLFVGGLTTADKLTLLGGALCLLCSFFPWKETAAEGEVIGLQSLGIVATGLIALAMVVVVGRARRSFHVNPAVMWLVQLACSGATIVWCLVFIKLSWDPTEAHSVDGNMLMATSKPVMGVYLCAAGAIIAAAGTLMGLKDSPT
ncbi:MAG TPA: hypothetical protein VFA20_08125 [Myxococcaceae bacterium]|nr:hypothetical protein [Myxococcaceae bacterium]